MKRQYGAVDLVKFLCALLIVAAHYITESAVSFHPLVDYGISVYVIGVPFFFACAGYFLFKKVFANPENAGTAVKTYLCRVGLMYAVWSVVYVGLQTATWIRFGVTPEEVIRYILNALTYSTYRTIWFLPALCVGVGLFWLLYRKKGMKRAVIWAAVLYLLGCLGVSYSFLLKGHATLSGALEGYEYVFQTTRNGLFHGFPLVSVGALLAHQEQKGLKKRLGLEWGLTAAFAAAFVAEALVLKLVFDAVNVNTLLMLVPFTYMLLRTCLDIPLASGKVLQWMRGMSTTIFLCQRIWLTALPALFPATFLARILGGNPWMGLFWVLSATLITAAVLRLLARRNRFFRAMC